MTPEELDEARKVAGGLFAVTDSIVEFYEREAIKTYSKLIRYIDELERENTDQAAEIKRLEDHHCEDCCCARSWEALGITEYTGRSIPEEITRTREQIKRLEDALVEERGKLFHQFGEVELDKPTESDCKFAREQLRAEGVIR